MKVILAAFVLFAVYNLPCTDKGNTVWAQGDPDAPCTGTCTFCLCTSDIDCASSDCAEPSPGDCTWSAVFRVPCRTEYKLIAKVICSGASECQSCNACVDLYYATNPPTPVNGGNCHTSDCGSGQCVKACPDICLNSNTDYIMRVCLLPCVNHTCNDCNQDCKAHGCIYHNVTTTCVPL